MRRRRARRGRATGPTPRPPPASPPTCPRSRRLRPRLPARPPAGAPARRSGRARTPRRRCSSPRRSIPGLSGRCRSARPTPACSSTPCPSPDGPFWTVRDPSEAWGTEETIEFVVTAIEAVEARYPGSPRLVIGDLSNPKGGQAQPAPVAPGRARRRHRLLLPARRGGLVPGRAEEGPRPAAHLGPRPRARHGDRRRAHLRGPLAHRGAVPARARRGRGPLAG